MGELPAFVVFLSLLWSFLKALLTAHCQCQYFLLSCVGPCNYEMGPLKSGSKSILPSLKFFCQVFYRYGKTEAIPIVLNFLSLGPTWKGCSTTQGLRQQNSLCAWSLGRCLLNHRCLLHVFLK